MAVILATFTDARDAERAAAALRASGFADTKVGTSDGNLGDLVGLGATEAGLRNLVIIGSTLAGVAALGGVGFLLGMFAMDIPDIRGQGNLASIGPALTALAFFVVGLGLVGGIGGLIGGFLGAALLGQATRKSVENGEAPRRPMLSVPVSSQRDEDAAHQILRQVGPPFEVAVR